MRRASVVFWFLAVVWSSAAPAADARTGILEDRPLRHYLHERWSTREGLPQETILGSAQTADGYLWFGTHNGLARFDGVSFRVFMRPAAPVIRRGSIWSVLTGRNGDLMFGDTGVVGRTIGSAKLDVLFEEFTENPMEVSALLEEPDGSILAGTRNVGLLRWDGRNTTDVAPERLQGSQIYALTRTDDGVVWVGTESRGLVTLAKGNATECPPCDALPPGSIRALAPARGGGVWAGGTVGLFRVDRGGAVRQPYTDGKVVTAILQTESSLWIGTTSGLLRLRDGNLEGDQVLEGASISNFLVDREGSLWVGTTGDGVHRLRAAPLWPLSEADGLAGGRSSSPQVIGNALWLRTPDGFAWTEDGKSFETVSRTVGSQERITSVGFAEGRLWAATTEGRLLTRTGRTFRDSGFKGPKYPISILPGSAPALWLTVGDGSIARVSRGVMEQVIRLPHDYRALSVQEWADGRAVIGSLGGLYEWRDGKLRDLIPRMRGRLNIVSGVIADTDETVWATTTSGGLYRVKNGESRQISAPQGLAESFTGVVDDGRGFLWLCQGLGAMRLSKSQANDLADGRIGRVTPVGLAEADGMPSGCGTNAALFRGMLFFPSDRTVLVADPARSELPRVPSLLRIVEARADGRVIEPGTSLSPGIESLEIDYASMSFRVPSRVKYTYQLIGYDKTPVDAQNRRTAYYSQLPHGDYRFVVSAVNEDGAVSPPDIGFDFSVAPRFHERTPVRVGFAALGFAGIAAIFRLRTRALRRRQGELERIVLERTKALAVEKERAEAASAAKTRFVSSVSHELRTPLNAILGFTDLLRGPSSAKNREEYLEIVRSSGAHLLTLVNSVLSLTEIEAQEQRAESVPFPPGLVIREVIRMMSPRAEAKGLRLLEDAETLPEWLLGDAPRIRQVLINLIGNAIKFTAAGHVTLHVSREGDRTTFAVEDSGPGIPQAEQGALFQEFSQTESGVRAGEGTGLGLAISRRLATMMGGSLVLESSSGEGSTFVLTLDLPQAEAPVVAPTRRVVGVAKARDLKPALVVDDSAVNRRLILELHERVGMSVVEAASGPEGLRLFETSAPSIVWTDAQMPGYGGEELVRRIRASEVARGIPRTPVVAVTASALGDERDALRRAGCDDVVIKPFEEAAFFEQLSKRLGLELEYAERRGGSRPESPVPPVSWGEDYEELRRAVTDADWTKARRLAHSLRGEAAVRGRTDVAAEFGVIEEESLLRSSDAPLRAALDNVQRLAREGQTGAPS